jgi:hypothetical protein
MVFTLPRARAPDEGLKAGLAVEADSIVAGLGLQAPAVMTNAARTIVLMWPDFIVSQNDPRSHNHSPKDLVLFTVD